MPGVLDPTQPLPPAPSPDPDDDIFSTLFDLGVTEGGTQLAWEQASECPCLTPDSRQPRMACPQCGGVGVIYQPSRLITGLFRDQGRWLSFRREGEFRHGEVQLTTPLAVKPGYVDRRVRDRFTVQAGPADTMAFYPAAPPIPFIFNSIQRAWRVTLQAADLDQQLLQ